MNGLLSVVAGMLVATGLIMALRSVVPPHVGVTGEAPIRRPRRRLAARLSRRTWVLLAVGVVAGLLAGVVSGVAIFVVVVPAALVGLPLILGKQDRRERDLLSALEAWARTLAAASATGRLTLREVISVTQGSAPALLRPSVGRLQHRISTSWTTAEGLRAFADEMESPWVDEVAIYLIQAAEFSSSGLAAALSGIADLLSAQLKLRAEVFKERERPRRVMVQITGIAAVTVALVVLFARTPQLAPYATPIGQLLLLTVLGTLAGLLLWARWIGRPRPEPRVLLTSGGRP